MNRLSRALVAAAASAALGACVKGGDPDEHLLERGVVTAALGSCSGGSYPDFAAVRDRFDRSGPMLKARGYGPDEMREAVLEHGGVLVRYRGRRFHSAYMAHHNWRTPDADVLAYAVLDDHPSVVYAQSESAKGWPTLFYPWSDGDTRDRPRPCR